MQPVILLVVKGKSGRGIRIAGKGYMEKYLVSLHPTSNIEIIKYINYEPRFIDVYMINLYDKKIKGILLFIDRNTVSSFDSLEIFHKKY